jgi:sigma-B regulation protein RsbU (phosphoserine phosphatase)
MVSLDVPVQKLSVSLDGLRRTTGQRPVLFAPGGTIAVHPDPDVAFSTTLAGYIDRHHRPDLAPMEQARRAGQALQFAHQAGAGGPLRYSVLQPVGDTGWALQLARDRSAMLGDFTSALRVLTMLGIAVALLSALAIHRLLRRITVPLEELTRSAGHFAAGEFEWPVPHDSMRDEVGVMARALERARDSIRLQMAEIARHAGERQKLQSELQIARDIQQSMLPPGETLRHGERSYLVQARVEPAKAVGGDFHSHFRHGDRLWFVVGDVSDKGIPAALFMARTLTVLEVATSVAASGGGQRCLHVRHRAVRRVGARQRQVEPGKRRPRCPAAAPGRWHGDGVGRGAWIGPGLRGDECLRRLPRQPDARGYPAGVHRWRDRSLRCGRGRLR